MEKVETEKVEPAPLQVALLYKILQAQRETLQFLKDVTPQGVDVPFDDQVVTGVTTIDLIKNYPYRPLRSIDFFNKGSDTAYIRINEDGKEISIENREAISVERPKATIRYITLRVGTAETSTIRLLGHY